MKQITLLFSLLLLGGCAEISPTLEVPGRLSGIATFSFEPDELRRGTANYLPVTLLSNGVVLSNFSNFVGDQGVEIRSFDDKLVRAIGSQFQGNPFWRVRAIAVSDDGQEIAVGAYFRASRVTGVMVYNVATGSPTTGLLVAPDPDQDLYSIAFDRDGERLAVGYEKMIAIYDLTRSSWSPIAELESVEFLRDIASLDFSPTNSDHLVTPDGIWSIAAGGQIALFDGNDQFFNGAIYNESGTRVVAGGSRGLHLVDAESGEELSNLRDVEESFEEFLAQGTTILSIDRTSDGRYGVTGATGGLLTVWDLTTGEIVARDTTLGDVTGIVCSPTDPRRFLSVSTGTAILWEFEL